MNHTMWCNWCPFEESVIWPILCLVRLAVTACVETAGIPFIQCLQSDNVTDISLNRDWYVSPHTGDTPVSCAIISRRPHHSARLRNHLRS